MRTPRTPALKQRIAQHIQAYVAEQVASATRAADVQADKLANRLTATNRQLADANKRIDELERQVSADHAKDGYRFSRAAFVRLGKELGFIQ